MKSDISEITLKIEEAIDELVLEESEKEAEKEAEKEQTEDWVEKRKLECPFKRQLDKDFYGCNRYEGVVGVCDGHCSWVVDYPKLKEFKDRIKNKMEQEDGVLTQIKNMEPISSDITLEKIEKATDELVQEVEKEQLEQKFANNKSEQQKWSEEDEHIIETLIRELRLNAQFEIAVRKLGLDYIQTLTVLDKCRRLYPQYHWKPTDEQMGVLMETIDSASDTYEPRCTLVSLYNDLKELKKE